MTESRNPQEPPRFDPFEIWRQFYETNEQSWAKSIREMTTTPDYVEAQGKMLETFLAYQKIVRDAMTSQLNFFNVPTRDDVGRLGEMIVGVEEKVDRLDEAIDKLEETIQYLSQQVAHAETPITGVEQKVDGLEVSLAKLEKAARDVSRQVTSLERPMDSVEGKVGQLGERIDTIEASAVGLGQQMARLERHFSSLAPAGKSDVTPEASDAAQERPRRAGAARNNRQAPAAGEPRE
jgi:polyhydroxyalkanoic acid synthase PhaR subunit